MIVSVDFLGRRYVEVPQFPAGLLKDGFAGSADLKIVSAESIAAMARAQREMERRALDGG